MITGLAWSKARPSQYRRCFVRGWPWSPGPRPTRYLTLFRWSGPREQARCQCPDCCRRAQERSFKW